MQNKNSVKNFRNFGFSLLELSIVVLILGIMIGGIMSAMTQEIRLAKQEELKIKMDAIENSLKAFVKKNNRLPCPADGTYTITNQYFGIEGGTAGSSCVTGATYSSGNRTADTTPPTANFYTSTFAGGVVPVRTLGLADEYAFDPWGKRFSYSVDTSMIVSDSFSTYFPSYPLSGKISVNDTSANGLTTVALAVVLSHGINGHGAFQVGGSRFSSGSTNTNEQINCHCDATASATAYSNSFVAGTTTASSTDLRNSFDDVLRFYTRGDFLNDSDLITEIK